MKLYNAGIFASSFDKLGRVYAKLTENEKIMRGYNPYYLESYHYVGKDQAVKRIRNEGVKIFIDSGAYSAYTQGIEIDLGRYIDYCHKHSDVIEVVSVLDEINPTNMQQAIKTTLRNLFEMERRGLKGVLPTFHMGEPEEVIKYYADNYDYISLGGLSVGGSVKQLTLWLDRIWGLYLTNADGTPKVKVHGFALTSLPLMMRYPWYSVDSSTWVQWAANGMVMMPNKFSGQINISSRSSFRKLKGQHFTTLSPIETQRFREEIEILGGEPQRLADLYYSRWAWNSWAFPYYAKLNDGTHNTFRREFDGLFDSAFA